MCFMLRIATRRELPRRPWRESDRHICVGEVEESAAPVRTHFPSPSVAYVGSGLNCGCGFRSVSFQNGGTLPKESLMIALRLITPTSENVA